MGVKKWREVACLEVQKGRWMRVMWRRKSSCNGEGMDDRDSRNNPLSTSFLSLSFPLFVSPCVPLLPPPFLPLSISPSPFFPSPTQDTHNSQLMKLK